MAIMKTGISVKVAADKFNFSDQFKHAALNGTEGKHTGKIDQLASQIKTEADRAKKLRIVNTTNNKEISFEFKQFGYKQYRVDRTVQALKAYLIADGLSEAEAHSVIYDSVQRNFHNRTEPLTGQAILAIKYQRDRLLARNDELANAPRIASAATVSGVSAFLDQSGFKVGSALGAGSFGDVKNLKGPDGNEHVVKFFVKREDRSLIKPDVLAFKRSPGMRGNEGIASYLAKSGNPQWQKTDAMVIPTHYVVLAQDGSGREQMEIVAAADIKARTRQAGGAALRCVAEVMDKVPGTDLFDALAQQGAKRAEFQANVPALARAGLETLSRINERGMLHRDIKPENLRCDGDKLYFIDWGLAYKSHKKPQSDAGSVSAGGVAGGAAPPPDLPTRLIGTPGYIHPEMWNQNAIGPQGDLYAFAITLLEMSSPEMREVIHQAIKKGGVTVKSSIGPTAQALEGVIDSSSQRQNKKNELKAQLSDPQSIANLALRCLELSDTTAPGNSAAAWANRDFSRAKYEELLRHPALVKAQPLIVEEPV